TRERMSDQEAKEIKAEAREFMPQPSTKSNCSFHSQLPKPTPLGDGSSKNYKVLSEMLEDFHRQDVEELYRLVKERYSTSRLEGYDLMLWGDLHTLFEPDEEDELWKN
ncbi:hypothetical protein Tco_0865783, partial [Tanacetum coccineum]